MIAAVDVDYRGGAAHAACVVFSGWGDAAPAAEKTATLDRAAPYEPGAFYKRELPALLAVLEGVEAEVVIVDGYVTLDGGRPGLGQHLFAARGGVVVGVAKTPFRGAMGCEEIRRGRSDKPLIVSAVGMDVKAAARAVASMHGAFRTPTLLGRVDRLARTW